MRHSFTIGEKVQVTEDRDLLTPDYQEFAGCIVTIRNNHPLEIEEFSEIGRHIPSDKLRKLEEFILPETIQRMI